MQIVYKQVAELFPYVNNARKNDHAVDAVASSIKNYGFKQPIVIDSFGEVVAGHTRLKAAKKLGLETVPCIVADDLTPAQVKAYRIADNKVAELSEWDMELLNIELADIEGFTGFDLEDLKTINNEQKYEEDNPYTTKIDVPTYEITGDKPKIEELCDTTKANILIKKIEGLKIDKEIKGFLINASCRHFVFDYSKIAEFYAHSDKEVQEVMEQLALVIIDFDKAIEYGYAKFKKDIFENENGEEYDE